MYDAIITTPIMCAGHTFPIGTRCSVGEVNLMGEGLRAVSFGNGLACVVDDAHILLAHSMIAVEAHQLCVACHDNVAHNHEALCDRCVQLTIEAVSIERAINHLIDQDERIAGVVEYDNNERDRSPVPYVTIHDTAWDWVSGASEEELTTIVTKWVPSIVNSMQAGTR